MKVVTNNKNSKVKKAVSSIVRDIPAWILILPAILVLCLVAWRPIFMGIRMAFMNNEGTAYVGLENFKTVISDVLFMQALKNTVMYVVWSLILGMFLPIVVAIMLNET
ncbi:MAG: hypothetical protein PUF72_07785, partial [Clostridiales bacterium]|nr:hypothetical protein [Clostridiales bacterium]